MLTLILGGAAGYRCEVWMVSAPALAAEVTLRRERYFCRTLFSRVLGPIFGRSPGDCPLRAVISKVHVYPENEDYEHPTTGKRTGNFPRLATAAPLSVRAGTQHGSPPRLRSAVEADCRASRPLLHPGYGRRSAIAKDGLRNHRSHHAGDLRHRKRRHGSCRVELPRSQHEIRGVRQWIFLRSVNRNGKAPRRGRSALGKIGRASCWGR